MCSLFLLCAIHNSHSVVSLIYALPISLQFTQMCARLIQLDSILIFIPFYEDHSQFELLSADDHRNSSAAAHIM